MQRTIRRSTRVLVAVATAAILAACGASNANSGDQIRIVGFAVPEAANKAIAAKFARTDAGQGVTFRTSYGPSGDQSRSVVNGLRADYVHLSVATDVERLVTAGLVPDDWAAGPNRGIVSTSIVVLGVREGNPKNIRGWDDLARPGVEVVTANPASSGAARWNALAAWGHVTGNGGTEAEAAAFLADLFAQVVVLTNSGRDATQAFLAGNGDVLLAYENEAILAAQHDQGFDYVVPDTTVLIENPGTVVSSPGAAASAWLDFVLSVDGQRQFALKGFRPLNLEQPGVVDLAAHGLRAADILGAADADDPFPVVPNLLTLTDDFGGANWAGVLDRLFGDGSAGRPVGAVTAAVAHTGRAVR